MVGMEWMEGLGWCVPLKDNELVFGCEVFLTRKCFNMLVNVGHVFHDGVCGHHVAYDIFPYCFFWGGARADQ